ncbi:MAG: hypothetical protein JO165_12435, partial [Candidatus Eremiobacteraeota bacterium]|nr:hypothetical protein [Candidatus Eremiobacteraeota bacterium]
MRALLSAFFTATLLAAFLRPAAGSASLVRVLPQPARVEALTCTTPAFPKSVSRNFDAGALELINERWRALHLPVLVRSSHPDVVVRHAATPAQGYELFVHGANVEIR